MDRNTNADKYVKELDPSGEMSHAKLLREIAPGARVLEFGPASGVMTREMQKRGCRVSIVEIDPECYQRALAFATDGWLGNIDTLSWRGAFTENEYDYILFADVLEHLSEPSAVLRACLPLLKEDGRLLVSVPNVAYNGVIIDLLRNRFAYTDTGILDNTHVHLFAYEQAVDMLVQCGFTPVMQDATYIEIGTSELAGVYESLPREVAAYLRGRPLGEAYQLLFAACKSDWAAAHPTPMDDRLGGAAEYLALRDRADSLEDKDTLLTLLESGDRFTGADSAPLLRGLAKHANEIYLLNSEIARLSELVSGYSRASGSSAAQIDALRVLRSQLNERDREIRRLGGEVEKLSAWGKGLDKQAAENSVLISGLNEQVEKLSAWGKSLDEEVRSRDGAIAQRDETIAQREEVIAQREEELSSIRAQIGQREESIAALEAQRAGLQARVNDLEQKEYRLALIENSKAWKLAHGLQKVSGALLPMGSRRRLVVRYTFRFLRHPVAMARRLKADRGRVANFRGRLVHGDSAFAGEQEAVPQRHEPPKLEAVQAEKPLEEYAPLSFPAWPKPRVSIIIPVYNQFEYTYACLRSILANTPDVSYEVIIADDCSTDNTSRIQELVKNIRVARTETNQRFLRNCNNAAKVARGEYIFFLNNDTQVQPDWLGALVRLMDADASIGMSGSKLIYPDGRLQEAGGILWRDGSAWNYGNRQDPEAPEFNYVKDVDYISGAAIMIRASLWKELGGFDDRFAPAYCEDSDLAMSVWAAGKRVVYQPASVVVHFEGVSNGTDTSTGLKAYQVKNQAALFEKWKDALSGHNENAQGVFTARDRSYGKKTILFVDHYVPQFDKDAGSRTVYAYLRLFAEQGYNVKFIGDNFYRHEPYTTALQQLGVEVLYGPWYAEHWKEWILQAADRFDYAFLNRPHISVKYIDFLREKTKAKIFYYGHDLHFLRMQREYAVSHESGLLAEAEQWKKQELSLMRKADMAAYPSQVEVEEIARIDPAIRAMAIPAYIFDNVPDVPYSLAEREGLFFIGGFQHGPNVDAVKWLAGEILPLLRKKLPGVVAHIAGSRMPEDLKALAGPDLVLEGMISDEELAGFYRRSRLCVVPLRYGAGIKGKVVESMEMGLPVVTTSCGAEGIRGAEDILMIADTPEEIAEKIARVYNDEAALRRASAAGVEYVRREYSSAEAMRVLGDVFAFGNDK